MPDVVLTPLPISLSEPRAWFAAREADRPLFHTLEKQQPFLVPSLQQEGVWGTGSTGQEPASVSPASGSLRVGL